MTSLYKRSSFPKTEGIENIVNRPYPNSPTDPHCPSAPPPLSRLQPPAPFCSDKATDQTRPEKIGKRFLCA